MDSGNDNTVTTASTIHSELEAMKLIGEALDSLSDGNAQSRVLAWVSSRFGIKLSSGAGRTDRGAPSGNNDSKEIPGIARITDKGFELTVRDVKARSANDAAIRLAHVVIYAHEQLTEEKAVSSRKVLNPALRAWRAYDGNTRVALASHKGIHRDGDNLSLDAIARKDAEKYVSDILDDSIQGTWNPKARPATRVRAGNKENVKA